LELEAVGEESPGVIGFFVFPGLNRTRGIAANR